MRHYNEVFVKFHGQVSVRTLCAMKYNHFRKGKKMRSKKMLAILVLIVCTTNLSNAAPMGTAWTYQGRLLDANGPADGLCDFEFKLFDDPCTGTQQGNTIEVNDLDVVDGYFTAEPDFGSNVFNGDARWLQIGVRPGGSIRNYSALSSRQKVTPTPYALQTRGIFVNDDGNVGIGTTGPQHKLHVVRNSGTTIFGYTRTGTGVAGFSEGSGTGVYGFSDIEDGYAGYFSGLTYFSHRVGIGTESPTRDLHIYRDFGPAQVGIVTADTSSKAQVIFGDGAGNKWTISSDNTDDNKLHFRSGHASGTPRVTFQQDGKVGIGTTNPAERLHVAGNLKVNGTITNGPGNVKTPIAYGIINSDGSLGSASSNVSGSFWNNTLNRYEITISGESLDWTSYIFNVTYINLNAPRFITASVENERLIVEIWSPSSTKVAGRFHFVVYKI